MKKHLLLTIATALAVASSAWLGCSKQDEAPDPDVARVNAAMTALNQQLDASGKYMDAVSKEWECQKSGDANGVAMWKSNQVVFNRQEHEAYQRLKALAP
jgi:hypothetical protein